MSDDEEETKRVVRSAREKRYEALNQIIKNIRNSKKIKDFTKMETGFVDLTKAYEKAKPVIEKEENGVTPRFFIRILVELEEVITETWKDSDGRKKMSKNNSKSLGALKQKLRKYMKVCVFFFKKRKEKICIASYLVSDLPLKLCVGKSFSKLA